jgi:hypothetical protein
MIFSGSKKNEKPLISDEKKFIVWLLKNLDAPDMKMVRKLFPKREIDSAVDKMANNIIENLNEHSNKEELMDFLVKVHEHYREFRSLIEKRGGFWRSPLEVQITFFQLLSKMVTLPYFIKYRYGVNLPLWDFKLPEYEDL